MGSSARCVWEKQQEKSEQIWNQRSTAQTNGSRCDSKCRCMKDELQLSVAMFSYFYTKVSRAALKRRCKRCSKLCKANCVVVEQCTHTHTAHNRSLAHVRRRGARRGLRCAGLAALHAGFWVRRVCTRAFFFLPPFPTRWLDVLPDSIRCPFASRVPTLSLSNCRDKREQRVLTCGTSQRQQKSSPPLPPAHRWVPWMADK